MDSSINPDEGASDTLNDNVELPVEIETLKLETVSPQVGDQVDLKVTGSVTRIVNTTAYVKPETINDSPMPATPIEPNPAVDEGTRLRQLSEAAGPIPGY